MSRNIFPVFIVLLMAACGNPAGDKKVAANSGDSSTIAKDSTSENDSLPPPYATKSVSNFSKAIGWPAGKTPVAPEGFVVEKFADALDNPRWIYVAPNGDVFVAESNTVLSGIKKIGAKITRKSKSIGSSANRITMFRDNNKDGVYESRYVFAEDLNRPLGMLVLNNHFYIANTDALLQFDYTTGDTLLKAPGKQLVSLPGGGYNNHWTRNIIANKTGDKIYISVGSGSNAGEHGPDNENRRANILEINPDGSGEKIYARGLRNPVGMGWAPGTTTLWAAVNERDELGDNLVPDYITSVKEGGFYGWPYFYFGNHEDPRLKDQPKPVWAINPIVPDFALKPHTASLGLCFYDKNLFPAKYRNGAFIGQHGSWNRSTFTGYEVVFVPFANGKPSGEAQDFLTGFIADGSKSEVYGRPVGVAVLPDGSLLVADDAGNTIWKVSVKRQAK